MGESTVWDLSSSRGNLARSRQLVSQADNFFVFHLLSDGDLRSLEAAKAHFPDVLSSSQLNEAMPGNGILWSLLLGVRT